MARFVEIGNDGFDLDEVSHYTMIANPDQGRFAVSIYLRSGKGYSFSGSHGQDVLKRLRASLNPETWEAPPSGRA